MYLNSYTHVEKYTVSAIQIILKKFNCKLSCCNYIKLEKRKLNCIGKVLFDVDQMYVILKSRNIFF